ncbi:hypothetical protein FHG87_008519 [Trinorchestia longiramus]|nr:hypothetical protein FHG87_008519 [Trinorchestia longiramus]
MSAAWSRRALKLRLLYGRFWFLVLPVALLVLLFFSTVGGLISPCALSSCSSSDDLSPSLPHESENPSLSDLNGIEICLSIKFAEPIQPLDISGSPQLGPDGPYSVVYNYLRSSRFYGVNETVTFSTHTTPEYMSNVGTVAERWDGPVSVALYVPSTDFCRSIHRLMYLRNCDKAAYREKVTWHIFWPKDSPPPSSWKLVPDETQVDCEKLASDYRQNGDLVKTWRRVNHLPYPINVGRNVARQASTTFFVLPSDVELFPSAGLAPQFINFIRDSDKAGKVGSGEAVGHVYVVPVFEVKELLPAKKEELMIQLARNSAVYFHRLVCPHCQRFPGIRKWIVNTGTPDKIQALSWTRRERPHHRWEPVFICTAGDPLYEERLSWEGLQDKMSQMHELCLRRYELVILDRAFLVHSPGIKRLPRRGGRGWGAPHDSWRAPFIKTNSRVYEEVVTALDNKYGADKRCPHH